MMMTTTMTIAGFWGICRTPHCGILVEISILHSESVAIIPGEAVPRVAFVSATGPVLPTDLKSFAVDTGKDF